MKKTTAIACLAAILLLLSSCAQNAQEVPELLVPVGASMDTAIAQIGDLEDVSVYPAAVAPHIIPLHFTHDAVIGEIPVLLGAEVKAGDPLILMDVSAVKGEIAALDAEKAQLDANAAYLEQLRAIDMELYTLKMDKAETEQQKYDIETEMLLYDLEYENSTATRMERMEAIAARRTELESQLEDTALTAPTDGRVAYIGCRAGQSVGAYDTLCVVTDDSTLTIQSSFISAAMLADAADVYALVGKKEYALHAEPVDEAEYARSILRGVEPYSVFTPNDTADLALGQSAAVCVVTVQKPSVLKVPVNSVFEDNGECYVYIVDGDTRTRRDVSIGISTAAETEITAGLEEGEIVYVGD